MAKVRTDLPGHVDLGGYPGMVSGHGERFADFNMQLTREAQIARAAVLNVSATQNRIASTENLMRSKELLCPRCRKPTVALEGGVCSGCNGEEAMVFLGPEQVTCSLCAGRGTVDVVPDEELIEKPLVPGGEDDDDA